MITEINKIFPDAVDKYFFHKAWSIFSDNRDFIIRLIIVAAVVYTVVNEVFNIFVTLPVSLQPDQEVLLDALFKLTFVSLLLKIVITVPESFLVLVFVNNMHRMYEKEQVEFGPAFTVRLPQWLLLYVYTVFVLFLEIIGFAMCIVPGVLIAINFAFLPFVVALEEDVSIIPRTVNVVSGRRWNVFLIYVMYFALLMALLIVSTIVMWIFGGDSQTEVMQEYAFSFTGLIQSFIQHVVMSALNFFLLLCFFQLYMMSRIEQKEIEVVPDV